MFVLSFQALYGSDEIPKCLKFVNIELRIQVSAFSADSQ